MALHKHRGKERKKKMQEHKRKIRKKRKVRSER